MIKDLVDKTARRIDSINLEKLEIASVLSQANTCKSNRSSIANKKLAEVEAAKVREKYAEKRISYNKRESIRCIQTSRFWGRTWAYLTKKRNSSLNSWSWTWNIKHIFTIRTLSWWNKFIRTCHNIFEWYWAIANTWGVFRS